MAFGHRLVAYGHQLAAFVPPAGSLWQTVMGPVTGEMVGQHLFILKGVVFYFGNKK